MNKKAWFVYGISVVSGILLILWGYGNLYPIENMENRLVEEYLCNWYTAPVITRIFIALNFILGLFLILNLNPGNILPKAQLGIMGLAIYDLFWEASTTTEIISSGYSRFFGSEWYVSLVICLLLIAAALALIKFGKSTDMKYKWIKYPLGITVFALPFILNPVYPADLSDQSTPIEDTFDLKLFTGLPEEYLSADKALLNLYSTRCPYCLNAIRRLAISQKQSEEFIPVFIGFIGSEEGIANFFEEARAEFDYTILETDNFYKLSGPSYPSFILLENGEATYRWNGMTFNYHTMQGLVE